MYFLSLAAFCPSSGINTDRQGDFPFISSADGLFEPDNNELNLNLVFPFERVDLTDNRFFYLSEPNLIKVFKNTSTSKHILVENIRPIENHYSDELKEEFYNGYQNGFDNFYQELGQTFLSLRLTQQKEVLVSFISYCHQELYFEGFAIPEVIYALGYIQANLIRAFKDYQNIRKLYENELLPPVINVHPVVEVPLKNENRKEDNFSIKGDGLSIIHSSESSIGAVETEMGEVPKEETKIVNYLVGVEQKLDVDLQSETGNGIVKPLLKYPANEITQLWNALLDIDLCKQLQVPQIFFEEIEVIQLLTGIFEGVPSGSLSSQSKHQYYDMAPNYQHLLSLLMHATYKLNDTYVRLPLRLYCEVLKQSFSPFQTIESVTDIASNITKKRDIAITAVEKSTGIYAKKALEILKKIPSYRLKS